MSINAKGMNKCVLASRESVESAVLLEECDGIDESAAIVQYMHVRQ